MDVAIIEGSVMPLVELSDTAPNGFVPPNEPPKLNAPALAVRSHAQSPLSTVPPKVVVAVPELSVRFVLSRTALLNVIGPLLVVTLPNRLARPVTSRPAGAVIEPTLAPKFTTRPLTVSVWSPSTVLTNVVAPAPESTVVSALRMTALLNVILPPPVMALGSRTVGPVSAMAPADVESAAPTVRVPPSLVANDR